MQSPIRVMIVDENEERAALIEAGIAAGGCEVVARLVGRADLRDKVNEIQPDVIIVDMDCPDRDTLEDMSHLNRHQPRPTVMWVDRSDSESIRAAVQAGVSAYVVGGLSPERVRSVIVETADADDSNTILLVTHDIRAAIATADHLLILGKRPDEGGAVIRGSYEQGGCP